MVDQFAANGYTCLLPDIFNGDQLSFPMPENFDIMRFINNGSNGKNPHTTKEIDEITIKGIKALKDLGVNKIGAVGYCFGAKVSCFQSMSLTDGNGTRTKVLTTQ